MSGHTGPTSLEVRNPEGRLFAPAHRTGTGVLVLGGSSGHIYAERAKLLSEHGALALAIRWFGNPGQQPEPFDVPIELFIRALDRLARECDHLAIMGTSLGAEAALVTAGLDRRVAATVAFAPSSVVWGHQDGTRWTAHWTVHGTPLPYVPLAEGWEPAEEPPEYRELYELSLEANRDAATCAAIPVENINGDVVLVVGGDDRVWPSGEFARRIVTRRSKYGLKTAVVHNARAGHHAVLPGEHVIGGETTMVRGGNRAADSELGTSAWPVIAEALKLRYG